MQPVTKDKNVESLLQKYPCQVVTSASVLTRLLDNHAPDFAAAWEIPVVVRYSDELGVFFILVTKELFYSKKKSTYKGLCLKNIILINLWKMYNADKCKY